MKERPSTCSQCHGTGRERASGVTFKCEICLGQGQVTWSKAVARHADYWRAMSAEAATGIETLEDDKASKRESNA